MKRYELIVVGAGPAGLSAAIEASAHGLPTVVFDENARPGGQLFKQIHKFFGSKEHMAHVRGMDIGKKLVEEARKNGAEVRLDSPVLGVFPYKGVWVKHGEQTFLCQADNIILATGASENVAPFENWTLPGVMGAGSAQTQMNLHGILPGKRVLMVGAGNVGLVVGMQLKQAGCELVAVVEGAPRIGGYGVHAAKLARTGVPFYLSHTVLRAEGRDRVERAVIAAVDGAWQPVPGTEKTLEVDTICLAVGLSPMQQLADMAGCECARERGEFRLVLDEYAQTTVPGIFAAGDVAGIEEASSAMIAGRIAGASAARRAGYLSEAEHKNLHQRYKAALDQLHRGMFAGKNKGDLSIAETDEGIPLSETLLRKGYIAQEEIERFPGYTRGREGFYPVVECTQNIPCNPCQDLCPRGCIAVGDDIAALPVVRADRDCLNCGLCVSGCPGQAIFLVNERYEPGCAAISLPYEFLPLPEPGDVGVALGRDGQAVCPAEIVAVKASKAFDHTAVLTMKVPREMVHRARFFAVKEEGGR